MCRMLRTIVFVVALFTAGCNLSTTAPTPYPTPDLPRVEFLSPANNSRVIEGVELDIELLGEDQTAGISKVEFRVDDELIAQSQPENNSVPVYRVLMNWRAHGVGTHPLSAIAYRPDGTPSDTATILVEVVAPGG